MKEVHCIKLDTKLEGLERAPYPGDLGKRILEIKYYIGFFISRAKVLKRESF